MRVFACPLVYPRGAPGAPGARPRAPSAHPRGRRTPKGRQYSWTLLGDEVTAWSKYRNVWMKAVLCRTILDSAHCAPYVATPTKQLKIQRRASEHKHDRPTSQGLKCARSRLRKSCKQIFHTFNDNGCRAVLHIRTSGLHVADDGVDVCKRP